MKLIILSAFNGRLRSEPMEWPDEPPYIRMPLSQPIAGVSYYLGVDIPFGAIVDKVGHFEHTGKYEVLPGHRSAAVYELTGI